MSKNTKPVKVSDLLFTDRELSVLFHALTISCEDGSIFGDNSNESQIDEIIKSIRRKARVAKS